MECADTRACRLVLCKRAALTAGSAVPNHPFLSHRIGVILLVRAPCARVNQREGGHALLPSKVLVRGPLCQLHHLIGLWSSSKSTVWNPARQPATDGESRGRQQFVNRFVSVQLCIITAWCHICFSDNLLRLRSTLHNFVALVLGWYEDLGKTRNTLYELGGLHCRRLWCRSHSSAKSLAHPVQEQPAAHLLSKPILGHVVA